MKVRLIKIQTIRNYVSLNLRAKSPFEKWLEVLNTLSWNIPSDILKTFNHSDILGRGSNRVVFDIGGNKYRMICTYYFGRKNVHLYINWIGTHNEYDEICSQNNQYTISKY